MLNWLSYGVVEISKYTTPLIFAVAIAAWFLVLKKYIPDKKELPSSYKSCCSFMCRSRYLPASDNHIFRKISLFSLLFDDKDAENQ
jgi:hypothetical protein